MNPVLIVIIVAAIIAIILYFHGQRKADKRVTPPVYIPPPPGTSPPSPPPSPPAPPTYPADRNGKQFGQADYDPRIDRPQAEFSPVEPRGSYYGEGPFNYKSRWVGPDGLNNGG